MKKIIKRILKILLGIFIILACFVGVMFFQLFAVKKELDSFVKAMVADFAENRWSSEIVAKYSSPGLQGFFETNKSSFVKMAALGKLKSYEGITKKFSVFYGTGGTTAKFETIFQLDKSPVQLFIEVVKIEDVWKLNQIWVVYPPEHLIPEESDT